MTLATLALAHAGGGAHVFRELGAHLRSLQLIPLDYPGHGRRIRLPLCRDLDAIAEDLLEQAHDVVATRPYAILGHSMGAALAALVARHAAVRGLPSPRALIVAASPAPGRRDRAPLHALPDEEFVRELSALGGLPEPVARDPMMMELFLPILRADFEALERWDAGEWSLDVPLLALHGRGDLVERTAVEAWRERTTGAFDLEVLDGGHFFLFEAPRAAAACLDRQVPRLVAG